MFQTKTKYQRYFIKEIFKGKDARELYGKWNALVAFDKNGNLLGHEKAHDGDFFPESFKEYVERIRKSKQNRNSGSNYEVYPVRVDIDITQKCNSNCTFCFSKKYQNEIYTDKWIPGEDLERLLISLSDLGVKSIRYCGGGEPLLHPEIRELLKLPGKYNLLLSLITNGDNIDIELAKIISKYVNKLHWSVNAASEQLRQQIHRPVIPGNSLHETMGYIRAIIDGRELREGPMVWASYLILPQNIDEIIPIAEVLKQMGVDSISYRPVFHGLHSKWSKNKIQKVEQILDKVKEIEEPPFYVFTPKRSILKSPKLNPNDFFKNCISRSLRTVIEPSSYGLIIQNCGLYRGSGYQCGYLLSETNDFANEWVRFQTLSNPIKAPSNCNHCIDVSMNVTLNFIDKILDKDINASFHCAKIENDNIK